MSHHHSSFVSSLLVFPIFFNPRVLLHSIFILSFTSYFQLIIPRDTFFLRLARTMTLDPSQIPSHSLYPSWAKADVLENVSLVI